MYPTFKFWGSQSTLITSPSRYSLTFSLHHLIKMMKEGEHHSFHSTSLTTSFNLPTAGCRVGLVSNPSQRGREITATVSHTEAIQLCYEMIELASDKRQTTFISNRLWKHAALLLPNIMRWCYVAHIMWCENTNLYWTYTIHSKLQT